MQNELFEKTPVPKAYLKFALPVVFSSVLMLVYNMVDTYFIARTGNTSIVAGVALCAPVFSALVAIGDILGLGGSSFISRLFGMGENEDGKKVSVLCFNGSIVIGVVVAVLLLLVQEPLLYLLGADAETIGYASEYFFWIAIGAPVIIFSLTPTNLLRTEGSANAAMAGSVLGSIVNIILDPIFIFTFGLGAAGAAIATVLGNVCADVFYAWFIMKRSTMLSMSLKGFVLRKDHVKEVLRIGIPGCVTNLMQSIGVTMLNRSLLPYGNETIAAMGIVSKVTMIVTMIMVGFSFGGQPLYGYLYGAKNHMRMKKTIRFAYSLVCGIALVMSLILYVFAPQCIHIFMNDASIVETGAEMLRAMLVGEVFIGFVMVTTCLFQSCGKAAGALALSAGRQGYVFFVTLTVLGTIAGFTGVIYAQPAADFLTAILAFVLYKILLAKELV